MRARTTAAALLVLLAAGRASSSPTPARPEHEVTAQDVVYKVPGMDRVTVKAGIPFKKVAAGTLRMDLYYPPDYREGSRLPAVIFLNGVGGGPAASLRDWGIYHSWGRLVAASGWIGVTFDSSGTFMDTGKDIADLFRFVRSEGASHGIQTDRIAAWVCSGNVPSGFKVLMEDKDPGLRAAVVYYGASDEAKIRTDLPVLLVKAGRDNPRLNAAIDMLIGRAAAASAPWTVIFAPSAHHAFDALDETDESRRIVRETLEFFRESLAPPRPPNAPPSQARRALSFWFAREYGDAADAYAAYVQTHPTDAIAWMRLGISQAHLGKTAEAEASLSKAVSLGADTFTDFYNVACGFAILGQSEKALDWLDRAVKAGFKDKNLLTTDDDLESLRGSERFQKLVAGLP